jgi:hypothetical protein
VAKFARYLSLLRFALVLTDFFSDFLREFINIMCQSQMINGQFPQDISRISDTTALFTVPGNDFGSDLKGSWGIV